MNGAQVVTEWLQVTKHEIDFESLQILICGIDLAILKNQRDEMKANHESYNKIIKEIFNG